MLSEADLSSLLKCIVLQSLSLFLMSQDVFQIFHVLCLLNCSDPVERQHSSSLATATCDKSGSLWGGTGWGRAS